MNARPWLLLLALAALGACDTPPTVKEVCHELQRCAAPLGDDCRSDGRDLESMSEIKDCRDLFDDYLFCLGGAACTEQRACDGERNSLKFCVGNFPVAP